MKSLVLNWQKNVVVTDEFIYSVNMAPLWEGGSYQVNKINKVTQEREITELKATSIRGAKFEVEAIILSGANVVIEMDFDNSREKIKNASGSLRGIRKHEPEQVG